MPRWMSAAQRFESQYIPEPNSGCWLWTGFLRRDGYGQLRVDGKRPAAHRFSYELHIGQIPGGLEIDHICRVRACVNPCHLEAVTGIENNRRTAMRGYPSATAANWVKTHCNKGHELIGNNLYVRPDGTGRDCRECRRQRMAEWFRLNSERRKELSDKYRAAKKSRND